MIELVRDPIKVERVEVSSDRRKITIHVKNQYDAPIRVWGVSLHKILAKPIEKKRKFLFIELAVRKEAEYLGSKFEPWLNPKHFNMLYPDEEGTVNIRVKKTLEKGCKYEVVFDGEIIVGKVKEGHPLTAGSEVTRDFKQIYIFEY